MELLFNSLRTFFQTQGTHRTYWLAYSGGLDSRVLVQLCAELRNELPLTLRAVYINHGLSPNALQWSQQCASVCESLQIDFQIHSIDAKHAVGDSPEEAARLGRYAVFAELLAPDDVLLTAHQQDDQAETLLLQLFRGAGPKGLAAMPKIKPFAKGFHARPLLDITRQDLQRYAEENQLQWIEDESNLNTHFTRNFLRHDVMPLLKTRWPTITKTLARSAEHCAEAADIIEDIAKQDLAKCKLEMDQRTVCPHHVLSLETLRKLTSDRQRLVLRAWFTELQYPLPSAVKLQQIQHDFLQAREDKLPHMQWGDVELRRFDNRLYVMKVLSAHDANREFVWDMRQPLKISGIGELRVMGDVDDLNPVTVKFRQGGEVCQLPGREHHHELKKLFQQWGVPPWERNRVPLIYVDGRLVGVVCAALSCQRAFTSVSTQMPTPPYLSCQHASSWHPGGGIEIVLDAT